MLHLLQNPSLTEFPLMHRCEKWKKWKGCTVFANVCPLNEGKSSS